MAAANSLARLEQEAGFPGEIFHEGSANWKTTRTFVLQKPQAITQSYFQQAETRTAAVFIQIRRTRGKRGEQARGRTGKGAKKAIIPRCLRTFNYFLFAINFCLVVPYFLYLHYDKTRLLALYGELPINITSNATTQQL